MLIKKINKLLCTPEDALNLAKSVEWKQKNELKQDNKSYITKNNLLYCMKIFENKFYYSQFYESYPL